MLEVNIKRVTYHFNRGNIQRHAVTGVNMMTVY